MKKTIFVGDLHLSADRPDITQAFIAIAEAIKTVSNSIPVYFTHGNRDFMVGKQFCLRAGMKILPEVYCINLYGVNTVILHGDSLCTLDIAYQRFRRFRSLDIVRWVYSHLPKKTRLNIAAKIRQKSVQGNQQKHYEIMDVESSAVTALLASTGCQRMIHGHTHRPAIHQLTAQEQRVVVGDWYTQGSVLNVSENGCELVTLPFSETN